jgi:hypothetical protein
MIGQIPLELLSRVFSFRFQASNSALCPILDADLFVLVERSFIVPPIVELRGARRGVVGHYLGVLDPALVFQVIGDPCGPQAVIADLRLNPGSPRPAPDHLKFGFG